MLIKVVFRNNYLKAYTVATMADESVLAMAMTEFNKTARNIRKEMSDCDSVIEQEK